MTKEQTIRPRVRFAPSPTGYLHVGGLRTALYNYLFARKNNGVFILRIEDTDRTRYVEGAVENLISTLRWAGLEYDEGPEKGGPCGPYVQSERLAMYASHADQLLAKGSAYRCFCTADRLEAMRKDQEKNKLTPKYDRTCLRLTPAEVQEKIQAGAPSVVRLRVPDGQTIRFNDIIRDTVEFSSDLIDDQVLIKSDGYPTYHLANVVDDHHMGITHTIRGEEWLPSTPKHVILYQSFGWELPTFAHLPLLLNPDRSKLSKRQGDVAVEDYRAKGYLKEALVNFVALLGWNPGTEQEIFSMEELIEQFSLERVNKAGAIFNIEKLDWLNFEHLKRKTDDQVLTELKKLLSESKFKDGRYGDEYLRHVIIAMRERVSFIRDFLDRSPYFFEAPTEYESEVLAKRWKPETANELETLLEEFSGISANAKEEFEAALHRAAQRLSVGNGKLIHPLRLAISGMGGGPGVYDIAAIIGKEETIARLKRAMETIKVPVA